MKPSLTLRALTLAAALSAGAPVMASNVSSGAQLGPLLGGPQTLMASVGLISHSQVFSDAITVTTAGTLTVQLSGISWLDALQNLNCFLSTPGGGILGKAQNGGFDSVAVQPGTIYVNWYGQDAGPLSLGAYSISVNFQAAATPPPPVPLPPALPLMLSGLAAVALGLRRSRPSPATAH